MTAIGILTLIVCIALILIVLVQNSKGGGLASNFASNTQVMGVRQTADFVEKLTWGCAIVLMVLCLLGAPKIVKSNGTGADTSKSAEKAKTQPVAPSKAPVTPAAPVK